MRPLEGAAEFAAAVRNETQLIILSDTFTQFAAPLMKQLNFPTIFCNELITDENGTVTDYRLRIKDGKRRSVQALQSVNFSVLAAGDSYNDLSMIQTADAGAFFRPPQSIAAENPNIPVFTEYKEFLTFIRNFLSELK